MFKKKIKKKKKIKSLSYNDIDKAARMAYMINNMTGIKRRTYEDMFNTIGNLCNDLKKYYKYNDNNTMISTNGITCMLVDEGFCLRIKIYLELN